MRAFLLLFALLLILSSCEKDDQSEKLNLSFQSFEFKEGGESSSKDTLVVTVRFNANKDNLGLSYDNDIDSPYHAFRFYYLEDSKLKSKTTTYIDESFFNEHNYIKYNHHDSLPPYSCNDYLVYNQDTLYVKNNKFFYNYFYDIYVLNNGVYEKMHSSFCQPLNVKFPPLRRLKAGETISFGYSSIKIINQFEGEITHRLVSSFFTSLFDNKSIKAKIQIADRHLRLSNKVETTPIIFE